MSPFYASSSSSMNFQFLAPVSTLTSNLAHSDFQRFSLCSLNSNSLSRQRSQWKTINACKKNFNHKSKFKKSNTLIFSSCLFSID